MRAGWAAGRDKHLDHVSRRRTCILTESAEVTTFRHPCQTAGAAEESGRMLALVGSLKLGSR